MIDIEILDILDDIIDNSCLDDIIEELWEYDYYQEQYEIYDFI